MAGSSDASSRISVSPLNITHFRTKSSEIAAFGDFNNCHLHSQNKIPLTRGGGGRSYFELFQQHYLSRRCMFIGGQRIKINP